MKVILTGFSGFLGRHIADSISRSGYELVKLGRSPGNNISWDFFTVNPVLPQSNLFVHCAGLAHKLSQSKILEDEFFKVNLKATKNICEALVKSNSIPSMFIFVSTVAVYGLEEGELISEEIAPNPKTAYGKSKLDAENFLIEWSKENNVKLLVLRLPLIVGEKPPGNLGSMIKAIKKGYYFRFGDGLAKRSMVLATDVADFIVQSNGKSGVVNLTDGYNPSFFELENYIAKVLNKTIIALPKSMITLLGKLGDFIPFSPLNSYRVKKLSHSLTFSDSKARKYYNWKPKTVVGNFNPNF